MDLWQMVLADHANIRELCREILHATSSGPNSRAQLFAELDTEVERHFRAKENVLYPALARDQRTRHYIVELEQEHDDIRNRLDELAAHTDKNSRSWALNFNELASTIRLHFSLEENGVLTVARGILGQHQEEVLRRAFEREKIASLQARRWHLPAAVMPGRYGISAGTALGVVASIAGLSAIALTWRVTHRMRSRQEPLRPVRNRPEPPFPLRSRVEDIGRGDLTATSSERPQGLLQEDVDALSRPPGQESTDSSSSERWFSSANPPRAPSGLGSSLQPGGMVPGTPPAASVGSIGTGGGAAENRDTGALKRDGR